MDENFICPSCRWYDCTQKQCFDGHLQPKTECEGYIKDTSIPTHKDAQIHLMKLYDVLRKMSCSGMAISFHDGYMIDVKIKKPDSKE